MPPFFPDGTGTLIMHTWAPSARSGRRFGSSSGCSPVETAFSAQARFARRDASTAIGTRTEERRGRARASGCMATRPPWAGSPEFKRFWRELENAMAIEQRYPVGSIGAFIAAYRASDEFQRNAESTQKAYNVCL